MPGTKDCVASAFKPFRDFTPKPIFYETAVPGKYLNTFPEAS